MKMTSGAVTLNGVSDKQLVTILEAKIKHEGLLGFNPQTIQPAHVNPPTPGSPQSNHVMVTWTNEEGFRAAIALLTELAGHKPAMREAA
jgi:hypothetical protein